MRLPYPYPLRQGTPQAPLPTLPVRQRCVSDELRVVAPKDGTVGRLSALLAGNHVGVPIRVHRPLEFTCITRNVRYTHTHTHTHTHTPYMHANVHAHTESTPKCMQAGMLICLCPSLRSHMYPICPALCAPNITQRWRRQSRTASMFIDRYTDITTDREACLTLLNEDVFHVHAGVLQAELGHARSNFIVMGFVRQGVINGRPASCVSFENRPRHSVRWWIFRVREQTCLI